MCLEFAHFVPFLLKGQVEAGALDEEIENVEREIREEENDEVTEVQPFR